MTEQSSQRTALLVVCLGAFITPMMLSAVNVAVPAIAAALNMDAITAGWVPMAYLLASAVFLLPFGRLGDIYGRKKTFLAGMATVTLASILAAGAPTATALICYRALQGTGAAMLFGSGIAILSAVYPPAQRGRVLGLSVSSVYLGLTCGPFLGGWVTQQFSWRGVFVFHLPAAALVMVLTAVKLKGEWRAASGEKFDAVGALIYGAALIALAGGLSTLPAAAGWPLAGAGVLGLALFCRYEKGREHPLFNVNLFLGNQVFTYSCIAALIMYSATFSITFLMSLYLQNLRGLTPQAAGLILIAQPLMMALFSPLAGRMSDRHEPRRLASAGMGLTALSLAALALAGGGAPLAGIVAALLTIGLGFALFSAPNINAIMSSVAKKHLGTASGTVATMRIVGQMFSMAVVTLVFALTLGPVQLAPEQHGRLLTGISASFTVASLLCLAGVYFSIKRGRLRDG